MEKRCLDRVAYRLYRERIALERLRMNGLGSGILLTVVFIALIAAASSRAAESNDPVYLAPGQPVDEDLLLGSGSLELTFVVVGDVVDWTLYPTQTPCTQAGSIRLTAGLPWQITVSSDTSGYLAEYDTSTGQYVSGGKRLSMPLNINVASSSGPPSYTGYKVDLSEGGILVEGISDLDNTEIPFTYEQYVSWQDAILPAGHVYRTKVNFIASSGS